MPAQRAVVANSSQCLDQMPFPRQAAWRSADASL